MFEDSYVPDKPCNFGLETNTYPHLINEIFQPEDL